MALFLNKYGRILKTESENQNMRQAKFQKKISYTKIIKVWLEVLPEAPNIIYINVMQGYHIQYVCILIMCKPVSYIREDKLCRIANKTMKLYKTVFHVMVLHCKKYLKWDKKGVFTTSCSKLFHNETVWGTKEQ